MTRLSFIPAQFVKVTQATRADLAQYVVAGIYIKEGAPGVARAWKVNADGSDGGEITFVNESGKDDTVSAAILPSGDVRLVVSEATAGGSGATAQPVVYLIGGVFPPAPPYRPAVDDDARTQIMSCQHVANTAYDTARGASSQANAATNMASSAIAINEQQAEQIAALDERMQTLEGA